MTSESCAPALLRIDGRANLNRVAATLAKQLFQESREFL